MKFKFLNLRPREDFFAPKRPLQTKSAPLAALQFTDSALNAVWSGRDFGALSREGYQKNAIVFRCVRLIARSGLFCTDLRQARRGARGRRSRRAVFKTRSSGRVF